MKKRLALFLALVLSIVSLFSIGAIGALAEETPVNGWVVEAQDLTVTKGSSINVVYTLKYNGEVVDSIINAADNGVEYTAKPYIELFDGETKIEMKTAGIIDTQNMEIGEKTITIKVYDKQVNGELLDDATFTLKVAKKDNTMTIIMIVVIVLFIGYFIWSNISNKKKQKQMQGQASQLKIGDRVKTIGGVCGFVSEINDAENTFTLEVGKDSFVKFDKGAIYQTAPAGGTATAKEETEEKVEASEEKKEDK